MLSQLCYGVLRASGLTALSRRVRDCGLILCYHNVIAERPAIGDRGLHLDVHEFERQVQWLSARYEVVSLDDFAGRLRSGQSVRRMATITFDDAYAGVFDVAWPVLRAVHLPATVFIPTDLVRRQMDFWWDRPHFADTVTPQRRQEWIDELHGDSLRINARTGSAESRALPPSHRIADWTIIARAAEEGLELGAHSATHRNLTQLPDSILHAETSGCRRTLFEQTGVLAHAFAYPYGRHDARVQRAVQTAGFSIGLTLDYGLNVRDSDLLALRRMNVPATISIAAMECWAAGLRPSMVPPQ